MGKLKDSLVKLQQSVEASKPRGLKKKEKSCKKDVKSQSESEDELQFDTARLMESDSEDDGDEEQKDEEEEAEEEENDDNEDNEDEEDVPLSDVELDDDADVVPFQKTTVNNTAVLKQSLSNIALPSKGLEFFQHMSVTTAEPVVLKDVYDDLERELAFYKQGLDAAKIAKKALLKENIPFTRPTDYFAEMAKSDEHMDKLKHKLIEEESAKKASQDAKRQRELKKFGKQVQNAKLQQRQKGKRETLEKIKSLKRKRAGNEISAEEFDIAVEEATAEKSERVNKLNVKRLAKNSKYGFGGKKKHQKSNDAQSSADMSGFSAKRMKAGKGRPAGVKSKRSGKSKPTKY